VGGGQWAERRKSKRRNESRKRSKIKKRSKNRPSMFASSRVCE
jgi:hypothetical protein